MNRPATSKAPGTEFLAEFEAATAGLRAALTELIAAVGADPAVPQEIARRFGVNRNMAWKVGRMVMARDTCEVVQHLPGDAGMRILIEAFEKNGAPRAVADEVRRAVATFDHMVATHAGTRPGLELMLTSMLPDRVEPARLESSHQLAFLGNSAIWGVQSDVRTVTHIVAPSADDPELVDIAVLSGHHRFRRLRPATGWHLNSSSSWGSGVHPSYEPLEPTVAPEDPPILRAFSSERLPEIRVRSEGESRFYELGEGPVGNTAAFSVVFGWMDRAFAPIHGDADDIAEHSVVCDTPTELLHFDLLVHRALPFTSTPQFTLVNTAQGRPSPPYSRAFSNQLACTSSVQALGSPPALATPDVHRYSELVSFATGRLGHELGDFAAYRLTLRFPPVPSMGVMSYPLALRRS